MPIRYLSGLSVDSTVLVVDAANDRVGIGTASPASKLDIFIPSSYTTAGLFSNSGINLLDPTTVGAYSQITFGYTPGRTYAAAYLGYVSWPK